MFCLPLQSYWYFLAMLQYQCSTLPERTSGKGANYHGQQKGLPRLWIWDLRKRQSQTLLLCTQGFFYTLQSSSKTESSEFILFKTLYHRNDNSGCLHINLKKKQSKAQTESYRLYCDIKNWKNDLERFCFSSLSQVLHKHLKKLHWRMTLSLKYGTDCRALSRQADILSI